MTEKRLQSTESINDETRHDLNLRSNEIVSEYGFDIPKILDREPPIKLEISERRSSIKS
jgi:hypothetical protein